MLKILRVFLTSCTVALVTCYTKRMTATCLPMIGHLCDTIIVASLVKHSFGSVHPSKYSCEKSAGNFPEPLLKS